MAAPCGRDGTTVKSKPSSNPSTHPSLDEISSPARRQVLRRSFGAAAAALYGPIAARGDVGPGPRLGFSSVPASRADAVVVPPGYVAEVLQPWGEPVGIPGAMPAWRPDASNTAAEQALQMGMHHDGLQYVPLDGAKRGLLVMNHEYTDDGLLFADGRSTWTAEKVAKAQAALGISVTEIAFDGRRWQPVRPSPWARRITAMSPVGLAGPAAGHALLRTAADPEGRTVRGTLGNCACSLTPWGTYLSGEEGWAGAFDGGPALDADQRRYALRNQGWSRWSEFDERFDARRHPNEFHRYGWIVEFDPLDTAAGPVKRTALGRGAHEGAWAALTDDGRPVVYLGEDARFEYIYKFIGRDRMQPGGGRANRGLLDQGQLYVARFDADGSGRWLPLAPGQGPLTAERGFPDAATVLVRKRQAADALGGTRMDRPEWMTVDHAARTVYCTLTDNQRRGQPGQTGTDAANPRARNTMGSVIAWTEDGDFDAPAFRWRHVILAGDPANERPEARGNVKGDPFANPDGLLLDARGVLWIETGTGGDELNRGEFQRLGNNQLLACDLGSGEVRRFMTCPSGSEVTGLAITPDGRTLFANIQHPGEPPGYTSDWRTPLAISRWPDGAAATRPRSATVVIRKADGGAIGS
jgi:secreted PhoX family phosphatase